MRVTELARQTRVSPHAIRFYARSGLLKPDKNRSNGYKMFGQNDVQRLRFIRMAQCLGYTLSEIAELLARLEEGDNPCERMERILRQRLEETAGKLESLQRTRVAMERALACLEKGDWHVADVEGLCAHFQAVVASG
ncbi:MAG TPA: MerR family transcriptional regulator [Burkholderiales bacterium]|nr:MerR family transcriptional regulator [Burkholderiales bacterium]